MNDSIIQIEHLTKTFGTGPSAVHALEDISLDIRQGEIFGIIGLSGAGKSTLVRCMNLLERPTSGSITVNGQQLAWMEPDGDAEKLVTVSEKDLRLARREVTMIFQSFNLIDELNVEENIELPLTYLNIPKAERKAKVQAIMKRMAISHRAKHFPHQLSGGQQQRVAIARAVVFGPKLILADEPTGNLDSKNGAEVMHLLTELNHEGTTIVMVTHNEHDAKIAHRTIRLFDGQIVEAEGNQL